MRIYFQSIFLVALSLLASNLIPTVRNQTVLTSTAIAAPIEESTQATTLFLNELQIIYLTNVKRREHGLAPLRWNRELHLAARWFAEDAVRARAQPYCGHEDSLERSPGERFVYFGYRNVHAWGENVICGMTTPQNAINGWMNSEGHRRNLLHADYREIGVGYYQDPQTNRGYISQEFSYDPTYAPVIIENEAPSVTSSQVNLYIYNNGVGEGFRGMSTAVEMMIANNPDFTDAHWQPFATELRWQLEGGEGWRTVYVKTRDAMGRTATVFDTVYVGAEIPAETLTLELACTYQTRLELESLDTTGWPQIQLSLNWQGDNSDTTFQDADAIGSRVNDADAVGGNTYFIPASGTPGNVRYWTTNFHKELALVAYFRLKTTNTTTTDEIVEISVQGGGVAYGPLQIKGTDFAAANTYQEFALPIRFNDSPDNPYLIFNFDHTGAADLSIDTITLFTESMPVAHEIEWTVPSGYHRSRGVWARFVGSDGIFSAATELDIFGSNADVVVPPAQSTPGTPDLQPTTVPVVTPTSTPSPTNPTPTPTPAPEIERQGEQSFTVYLPIAMR